MPPPPSSLFYRFFSCRSRWDFMAGAAHLWTAGEQCKGRVLLSPTGLGGRGGGSVGDVGVEEERERSIR